MQSIVDTSQKTQHRVSIFITNIQPDRNEPSVIFILLIHTGT